MAVSSRAQAALALALACAAPFAHATIFPVTGTITVNGSSASLPAGGTFGDADYDVNTGVLSDGSFAFPDASVIVPIQGFGNVTVNYRFSQTNTASAAVAADGVAVMTLVHAKLEILSTSLPLPVTPCVFEPIALDLAGTGSASGLDLADASFTVPPTASSCGGFASQINSGLAGSNNSLTLQIAGDFTPPAPDDDTIFVDGFDGA
ncbi:MAG: hypothetical protein ACTHK2_01155 [Dokdonella sp.]|uniref:hypothetical protein n=1 Tax=Dokdonella sp. TaxID=2291710 RepID=UPI003F7EC3DD